MKTVYSFIALMAIFYTVYARRGFGNGRQDWGYITVRPRAHIFWWLYETTADVVTYTKKPLIIWLQGGPGASASGFGNFAEIGPLDVNLKPRNYTWIKHANVLFIDNPVGTGFSYVENSSALTTTNRQIADDLVGCLKGFYQVRHDFKNVPLYVVAESYGGKIAVEFALIYDQIAKKAKKRSNLVGLCLIDSWISPIESVSNWAPFLFSSGVVDQEGLNKITKSAEKVKLAVENNQWVKATEEWNNTQNVVSIVSKGVNFYNILKKVPTTKEENVGYKKLIPPRKNKALSEDAKVELLMNGPVKRALNLNETWQTENELVFNALWEDFMKPVTNIVEQLLNQTSIKIQVVTGQLDLIVETMGTVKWVDRLHWNKSKQWKSVPRSALSINETNEGYRKILDKLSLYWVNRAGHMVPEDNPVAMELILKQLINP